ncbi:MAG: fluoride efflux transporter CrcB [Chloroflexi bacterium]|nr:fluoride efflux transporter CrcB [Chloroflexota bacterium]
MESLIYVGLGGFFGANARYALSLWVNDYLAPRWGPFPYGTFLVNVIGSFGLAILGAWVGARTGLSPPLRLLVGAGFFGAFTTFSTFANESIGLMQNGDWTLLFLNLLLNNGGCLLGVVIGLFLGHRLFALA